MPDYAAAFRQCLEECDIVGMRRLWQHVQPNLPQPETAEEARASIHHARTQAESIAFYLRAYSHSWLIDHGLPSALPDELKPRAERIYPRIVEGVGLAVMALNSEMQPFADATRELMEQAVLDIYADSNHPDPELVKERIASARRDAYKSLLGRKV